MFQLSGTEELVKDEDLKIADQCFESLLKNSISGFYDLPNRRELWEQSAKRADEIRRSTDLLVVVGIGGSSLGARAIDQAFTGRGDRCLAFLDNVDGWELKYFLNGLQNIERTHWLFISKSGSTLETLALVSYISQHCEKSNWNIARESTVISEDKSSALTDWAKEKKVPVLDIPLDVGGRFSVLTPVGMLPAAFLGLDIEKFRQGAADVLRERENVLHLAAFSKKTFDLEMWITGFWIYSSRLYQFGRWIQQLWAESLAKKVDREGKPAPQASVPLPLLGSTDQHSVLQQLAEGHEKKSIWFVRVDQGENSGEKLSKNLFGAALEALEEKPIGALLAAFCQSTRESLRQAGVASVELRLSQLDEREVGALFMAMMMVTGVLGECLNINAFDQPGVELGKKLVKNYL